MLILTLKEIPNIVAMVTLFWRKIYCEKSAMGTYTLAKFRLDMITLTVSTDIICLFDCKKKKLLRASLISNDEM